MNEEELKEELKKEFDKRTKSLKLDDQAKEELFNTFSEIYNNGFTCAYCGKRMELKWGTELSFSIDNIIPRKVGGQDNLNNLAFVCRTCNFLKGKMDLLKFLNNLKQLQLRKWERETWKARKSSKKDEQTRESFKDMFEMRDAKNENR